MSPNDRFAGDDAHLSLKSPLIASELITRFAEEGLNVSATKNRITVDKFRSTDFLQRMYMPYQKEIRGKSGRAILGMLVKKPW